MNALDTPQGNAAVTPAYLLRAALDYIPLDGAEERDLREAIEDTLAAGAMKPTDAKHTPGPWNYTNTGNVAVFDSSENRIATVHSTFWRRGDRPESRDEHIANAELIASAPTLLAEVERLRAEVSKLRAALAAMLAVREAQASAYGNQSRGADIIAARDALK